MSQADDRASLLDILKAARLVATFVDGMDEAGFSRDPKTVSAVHIHDYGDVDLDEVWRTATVAIPLLISQVEPLA